MVVRTNNKIILYIMVEPIKLKKNNIDLIELILSYRDITQEELDRVDR